MAKRTQYEGRILLAPGEQVIGQGATYVVDKVVGFGAFAAVYSAYDPAVPGRHIALKEFFPVDHPSEQANIKALFERERVVGLQVSPHPLMPTFYQAFTFENYYYLALEFIEGVTLEEIIRKKHPLPSEWILKWAVSLCDALAFMHARQIIHHDLKPANIRISPSGHLTLLDFGAAQYFGKGHENDKVVDLYGTEGYLPPELDGEGQLVIDLRTDIFALGCVLYEMIAGTTPDRDQISHHFMHVTKRLMETDNPDMNLIALINRALSYDAEYRYDSANEFLLDLRKIAPPVLLVSKKHLRYGTLMAGDTTNPLKVVLYNAGGGELRGEVKPRSPWVETDITTFAGNYREISVRINTTKIPIRNEVVTGRLEINSTDIYDDDGKVQSAGDRWFIETSITLKPSPGRVAVTERPVPESSAILLAGKSGQPAAGTFELKNVGDAIVEATITREPIANASDSINRIKNIEISPEKVTLAPGERATVTLGVPKVDAATGDYDKAIMVRTNTNQALLVPISIQSHQTAKKFGFNKETSNSKVAVPPTTNGALSRKVTTHTAAAGATRDSSPARHPAQDIKHGASSSSTAVATRPEFTPTTSENRKLPVRNIALIAGGLLLALIGIWLFSKASVKAKLYPVSVAEVGGGATVWNNDYLPGGKHVGQTEAPGSYILFKKVDGGSGGTHTLIIHYASAVDSKHSIYVNGKKVLQLAFPKTAGWGNQAQNYGDVETQVDLDASSNNTVAIKEDPDDDRQGADIGSISIK